MMQTHTISAFRNTVVSKCQAMEDEGWSVRLILAMDYDSARNYNEFFVVFEKDITGDTEE